MPRHLRKTSLTIKRVATLNPQQPKRMFGSMFMFSTISLSYNSKYTIGGVVRHEIPVIDSLRRLSKAIKGIHLYRYTTL